MDPTTIEHLKTWVGHAQEAEDVVTASRVAALAATLDREDAWPVGGSELPPLWHWTLCTAAARHSEIGPDGHPARGGFLPPVPLPRRMWAGGRLKFLQPLRVGEAVHRHSRVLGVEHKSGRSGDLVFVRVGHEYSGPQGLAISEEHDIVYRPMPSAGTATLAPAQAPAQAAFEREVRADDVLLFRYSSLTFNAHRIHYDRTYATGQEGYPGLIVHGPLIATLLLDLLRRALPDARVAGFHFRAVSPTFDTAPFLVCGRQGDAGRVSLWARSQGGALAMEAEATLV